MSRKWQEIGGSGSSRLYAMTFSGGVLLSHQNDQCMVFVKDAMLIDDDVVFKEGLEASDRPGMPWHQRVALLESQLAEARAHQQTIRDINASSEQRLRDDIRDLRVRAQKAETDAAEARAELAKGGLSAPPAGGGLLSMFKSK